MQIREIRVWQWLKIIDNDRAFDVDVQPPQFAKYLFLNRAAKSNKCDLDDIDRFVRLERSH